MKKLVLYILSIFLFFKTIVLTTGCANIVPPTGGRRDSLPPVLVYATPLDSARNFTGNRITLAFDEYVDMDQSSLQNIIVSPTPKLMPVIEHKLRNVTIKLKDTLEKNTTYFIN